LGGKTEEKLSSNLKIFLVLTAAIEKKEENSKPGFEHFGVFGDKDLVWTQALISMSHARTDTSGTHDQKSLPTKIF
jgi:hypothetical protein